MAAQARSLQHVRGASPCHGLSISGRSACVHPKRSWSPLSGEGRRSRGGVLHRAPRIPVGASAASGVRECFTGRRAASAQRSRGVGVTAIAERPASRARRMEPRRAESRRSAGLHCRAQEGGRPFSQRDGNGSWGPPDPNRRSRRQSDRALRTGAIAVSCRSWPGRSAPLVLPALPIVHDSRDGRPSRGCRRTDTQERTVRPACEEPYVRTPSDRDSSAPLRRQSSRRPSIDICRLDCSRARQRSR